jgi:excisionase family DNA binding protein
MNEILRVPTQHLWEQKVGFSTMKDKATLTVISGIPSPIRDPNSSEAGIPTRPSSISGEAHAHTRRSRPRAPETERDISTRAAQTVNEDRLLTVDEFADQLRVSRACVRKWILTRRVGVVKVGRLIRLRSSELRRIIDEGSRPRLEGC